MTSAELYKLRTHRTPLICAAVLLLGVLIPSLVLIWYTPKDPAAYSEAFTGTFEVLAVVLAVVFGGWLLGTEYRQGTVRRLVTSEPRRLRALATKGLVGVGALGLVLAVSAVVGWGAARLVGSMNDVTVAWEGRSLLAYGLVALIGAAVAYALSAITRSDAFAMVGAVALVFVVDPLLRGIPTVGKYSFGSAVDGVTGSLTGEALVSLSASTATIALALWLGAFFAAGATLFASRDI